MSPTRKRYVIDFMARIFIFVIVVISYVYFPSIFNVLEGNNFFHSLSPLHFLWGIWMIDMLFQIIPIKSHTALGSQKLFAHRFRRVKDRKNDDALRKHMIFMAKGAFKVFVVWTIFIAAVGILYYRGITDKNMMFVISVFFYVCDLICVLIWCPFRLLMKNRCCTTCRIFNWDHIMMFSPLIFVGGFYCLSLVTVSVLALLIWEVSVVMYPERFSETTNLVLKCSECTDKLCTQYCEK